MTKQWEEASHGEAQVQMMTAASNILDQGVAQDCPICGAGHLRYYCRSYSFSPDRGTIWVWCPNCRNWLHLGRVQLHFQFADPIDDATTKAFGSRPAGDWIDYLNELWMQGKLTGSG